MSEPTARARPSFGALAETLSQPTYWPYVLGNAVSLIGDWLQRTAIGWHVFTVTGSAGWVGAVAFADLAPTLLIGPFAGVLADRVDRRRIMILCQLAMLVLALIIWAAAATDRLYLPLLVTLVALNGAFGGLMQPARLALIASLVPRRLLPTAVAINSITFNTARFIGPAAAGLVIASLGLPPAFLLNAVSYLVLLVVMLRLHPLEQQQLVSGGSVGRALIEGLRYVASHPSLGPLFLLFIAGSLTLRSLGELLPALAGQVFHGDVGTLASLSSTLGLGAIAGGIWIARQPGANLLQVALWSHAAAAVAAAIFMLAPSVTLALPVIAAFGFAGILSGVSAQTLIQLAAAPQVRGRVMSMFGLTFRAAPAVGALLLGLLGDAIGLRPAQLLGLAAFALVWTLIWRRRAALAKGFLADEAKDG